MNKTILRLVFLAICALLLGWGLWLERHEVRALDGRQPQRLTGPEFVQGATVDSFMRTNDGLFDVYSLSKATANEKDCKT